MVRANASRLSSSVTRRGSSSYTRNISVQPSWSMVGVGVDIGGKNFQNKNFDSPIFCDRHAHPDIVAPVGAGAYTIRTVSIGSELPLEEAAEVSERGRQNERTG
jgi:hypothetical protein